MKSNGKILFRGKRNTKGKRINGVNVECVAMRLPDEEPEYYSKDELNVDILSGFEPL